MKSIEQHINIVCFMIEDTYNGFVAWSAVKTTFGVRINERMDGIFGPDSAL